MGRERYLAKSVQADGTEITVADHLKGVAKLAETYGKEIGMSREAMVAGLFHDFGKYSQAFQEVLGGKRSNVDHASAGAFLVFRYKGKRESYRPVIEAVNGHHDGLLELSRLETYYGENQKGFRIPFNRGKMPALAGLEEYRKASACFQADFPQFVFPKLEKSIRPEGPDLAAVNVSSMLRTKMLFSCLVDADYSVSACDKDPGYLDRTEGAKLSPENLLKKLSDYQENLRRNSRSRKELNLLRDELFEKCGTMGDNPEGLFSLTAPTGMGKTLALLNFALRHCVKTGKQRIIVVLPFLTLAEQSTKIYSAIVPDILVDHSQSNLSDEEREFAARWSSPFIVTTSVKFFEALFAGKPTDCRKLHHIANSVVLFDEAQSLPPDLMGATLLAVNELCRNYHTTVVFSSATQPGFQHIPRITWAPLEILPEHPRFYAAARRVKVQWRLKRRLPLEELAGEMAEVPNVCAIVNLRLHARKLFRELKSRLPFEEGLFFLTTDQCPADRAAIVQEISARKDGEACRVVATQCIEAGVDLDFQALYRALAPLDSIIQAAGRCNRNGTLPEGGAVTVFIPDEEGDLYPDQWYGNVAKDVGQMALEQVLDIEDPVQIAAYYRETLAKQKDKKSLCNALEKRDYKTVEAEYHLIREYGLKIIVPCQAGPYAQIRGEALRKGITPLLIKNAAPITVSTSLKEEKLELYAERLRFASTAGTPGEFSDYYLLRPQYENCYSKEMGLQLPEEAMVSLAW